MALLGFSPQKIASMTRAEALKILAELDPQPGDSQDELTEAVRPDPNKAGAKLLRAVRACDYDSSRIQALQMGLRQEGTPISARYFYWILRTFDYDSDRVKAVTIMASHVVGSIDLARMRQCFDYDSDWEKAYQALCLFSTKSKAKTSN